jgi:hypothetical protein
MTVQQTSVARRLRWKWRTFVPVVDGLGYWYEATSVAALETVKGINPWVYSDP